MLVPLLPEAVEFVLAEHRQQIKKGEGANATIELGDPVEGAPVWRFRPLNTREQAEWRGKLDGARDAEGNTDFERANAVACDLFVDRFLGVTHVLVPGEGEGADARPFNAALDLKRVDLPFDWVNELVGRLLFHARLGVEVLGKSA